MDWLYEYVRCEGSQVTSGIDAHCNAHQSWLWYDSNAEISFFSPFWWHWK